MYLSRKLATALVMAISLFKREPGMLICAFLLVLFTYILDIINKLVGGGGFSVLSVVFIVLAVPALWKLWPMIYEQNSKMDRNTEILASCERRAQK